VPVSDRTRDVLRAFRWSFMDEGRINGVDYALIGDDTGPWLVRTSELNEASSDADVVDSRGEPYTYPPDQDELEDWLDGLGPSVNLSTDAWSVMISPDPHNADSEYYEEPDEDSSDEDDDWLYEDDE